MANIDWPSQPGLSAAAQRAEALAILDRALAIGLNALVLQVRPAGDALYASTLEPWSEVLSGQQGRAPGHAGEAAYDPLAFWVTEAHRRGLELHAWFNPYRARHSSAKSPLAMPHLGLRQPTLVKRYGDMLWMDPGEPAAAAHTLAVVADVARRYDIDGVHIDDYFYPYPVPAANGTEQPFPDDDSYARHLLAGATVAAAQAPRASPGRDDWRRSNVDSLVRALYRTVHEIKPWLRVGISPFGIGRPDRRPPGVIGFSQYDKLYADVERWLHEGWLDYLAPQLYWPIDRAGQQFALLLDGWINENRAGRHLWPGLYTSQVQRAWPAREVIDQVVLQRSRSAVAAAAAAAAAAPSQRAGFAVSAGTAVSAGSTVPIRTAATAATALAALPVGVATGASGHIHFSMVALMQDRDGVATLLQLGPYAEPALVPATPWLGAAAPPAPQLRAMAGARVQIVAATAGADGAAARWAVWRRRGGRWRFAVLPGHERSVDAAGADALAVSAVDRLGNLSSHAIVQLP